MKDLSYLNAFSSKAIRSARRIMSKGLTIEDLDEYLENESKYLGPPIEMKEEEAAPILKRLEKSCCGEGKVDAAVAAFREKQRKKRGEE